MSEITKVELYRTPDGETFNTLTEATYHLSRRRVSEILVDYFVNMDRIEPTEERVSAILNTMSRDKNTRQAFRDWLHQCDRMENPV